MSDTNSSALTALATAQQVTANNIANINTDSFQASTVHFESGSDGQGVRVSSIKQTPSSGTAVGETETSNIDVTREMVDLMTTGRAFSANVTALRVSEEMTGHLFNMIA